MVGRTTSFFPYPTKWTPNLNHFGLRQISVNSGRDIDSRGFTWFHGDQTGCAPLSTWRSELPNSENPQFLQRVSCAERSGATKSEYRGLRSCGVKEFG